MIEFHECTNDFVINVERKSLIELIWSNPSNVLSHNFNLIVNALNTEEGLGEALGDGAIGHPLRVQLLADLNVFVGNFEALMLWKVGEQRDEAKSVVHVSQGILEGRIALSDHVAQRVLGHLFHVVLCLLELLLSLIFLVFLQVCFYVSEFLQ